MSLFELKSGMIKESINSLVPDHKRLSGFNNIKTVASSHIYYYINQMECVARDGSIDLVIGSIQGLFFTFLNIPFTNRDEHDQTLIVMVDNYIKKYNNL